MRLKMLLDTVKAWWKPENGTVSMWDLTMAQVQVKLLTGLISTLFPVEKATSKILSGASEIRSRAKGTISRRTIEQIKPVEFKFKGRGLVQVTGQNTALGYSAHWTNSGLYNTAIGYQAGYNTIGTGLGISNIGTKNSIQFNNTSNDPVLIITQDGDVEWHGKPSEAAEALKRTFQFAIEDKKGITKAARRRYYFRAIDNLAKKSRTMSAEQFVDFVQKQAYTRERRVIIDSLKGENVNS